MDWISGSIGLNWWIGGSIGGFDLWIGLVDWTRGLDCWIGLKWIKNGSIAGLNWSSAKLQIGLNNKFESDYITAANHEKKTNPHKPFPKNRTIKASKLCIKKLNYSVNIYTTIKYIARNSVTVLIYLDSKCYQIKRDLIERLWCCVLINYCFGIFSLIIVNAENKTILFIEQLLNIHRTSQTNTAAHNW